MNNKDIPSDLIAGGQYLVDLYAQWARDPKSVDPSFQRFFSSLDEQKGTVEADSAGPSWEKPKKQFSEPVESQAKAKTEKSGVAAGVDGSQILALAQMVHDFRAYGHRYASLDPLGLHAPKHGIEPADYGFSAADLNKTIYTGNLLTDLLGGQKTHKLSDVVRALRDAYCGCLGFEFLYVKTKEERDWFISAIEGQGRKDFTCSNPERIRIVQEICAAEGFEAFCHKRFVGAKRFGLEGGEVFIPALNSIVNRCAGAGVPSMVVGMAHRGRLNALVNVLGKDYSQVFAEFSGDTDALFPYGSGDVKYHLGFENRKVINGKSIDLYLLPNPSHLEAVDPVVCGAVRALQEKGEEDSSHPSLGVLVHGDAAFAAQGVVYETLEMSQLAGFNTHGTIHIVINNQIGFTTNPTDGCSGEYATDIAKAIEAPVIHVNGDKPEDVVFAAKLAFAYRQKFHADIVIDLVCFRRYGHNELDEPVFTQPEMYQKIKAHRGLYSLYSESLIQRGCMGAQDATALWEDFAQKMEKSFQQAAKIASSFGQGASAQNAQTSTQEGEEPVTGITPQMLDEIGKVLVTVPEGFALHRKIVRQLKQKQAMIAGQAGIDWATAEALAFGSLLCEDKHIRFSGEDSQRGTFSQRHAVWFDQKTQAPYIPLNHLEGKVGKIAIWNSLLSEYGALGFEYGYSIYNPQALTLWEAQFGDFVNCAQVIIDQFISSAQSKWNFKSNLVLLLPHGYEGQGPEHSSARLERFLQLCAENNLCVCNISSPVNFFHLLRRQMHQAVRRPLIVMEPKSLLRLPSAVSPRDEFLGKQHFRPVMDDALVDKKSVRQIVLCTGKVYYDLLDYREKNKAGKVAIIRVEQLYPFPAEELAAVLKTYPSSHIIWCQEEPQNYGAWRFIQPRLRALLVKMGSVNRDVGYAGRDEAASPATGVMARHIAQQKSFIQKAFTL